MLITESPGLAYKKEKDRILPRITKSALSSLTGVLNRNLN